ncbi:MAG: hypothetical protein GY749_17025 [Desulfobacteraceae bacterium]|nr:hypothetical protein [Desulfobacteraceae bacterium]
MEFSGLPLNEAQAENLRRFVKKLPKNVEIIKIRDLPMDGKIFQADVQARNISGSFARYEKQIDASGKTILYTKTTASCHQKLQMNGHIA